MTGTYIDSFDKPLLHALATIRFFTIQSNLLIGVIFLLYSISDKPFIKNIIGGPIVYISITFLGFFIMIEKFWDPVGVSLVGSIFNHYIVPFLSLTFIFLFKKNFEFKSRDIKLWIIYPLLYLIFLLIYGSISSDYIYTFLDLNTISTIQFIITVLLIIMIFIILSLSLIFISRKKASS